MQKLGVLEDTLFIPMLGRIYASEHLPANYMIKSIGIEEQAAVRS